MPSRTATRRSSRGKGNTGIAVASRWAFLLGILLAIIVGLVSNMPNLALDPAILDWLFYLLMVLGFFAGYVFISQEHEHTFLLLAIGLAVFANSFGNLPTVGAFLNAVLGTIGYFFGVVVVAIVVRKIIAWYME